MAVRGTQAVNAGTRGQAALLEAEKHLRARDLDAARSQLSTAQHEFHAMAEALADLGPLLPVARRIPLLGSQVVAAEALVEAGTILASTGLGLVDAADGVLDADDGRRLGSGFIEPARRMRDALRDASVRVDAAMTAVTSVDGWVPGTLGDTREALEVRLRDLHEGLGRSERGLEALLTFAGASGPRRYLFLTQNPDEVRPTGGFIGTYGLLTADVGELHLERYESIQSWVRPRPDAVVPGAAAGSPFRFSTPPVPQTLATVNHLPDWPRSAALAAELWRQGGEEPVDGVVSFVPEFLARLLVALGPVEVPEFGETITSVNLAPRLEHYTELAEADPSVSDERKEFLASLAEAVMGQLLVAPSSIWDDVAAAVGLGFGRGEAMAWSLDQDVAGALRERDWDGAFPQASGDFFFNSEFSYAAKNGNGIRRHFDHHVSLRPDGSALVTTEMTLANTEDAGRYNTSSLSYITIYGPRGATLAPTSDPPLSREPPLAGHPAAGWLVAAPPQGTTHLRVAWEVPQLLGDDPTGIPSYRLTWPHLPGHEGDTLQISVELPEAWAWAEEAPPTEPVPLDRDLVGRWKLVRSMGSSR